MAITTSPFEFIEANTEVIPNEPDKFKITYRLLNTSNNLVEKKLFVSNYVNGPIESTHYEVNYPKLVSNIEITDKPGSGEIVVIMDIDIPSEKKPVKYQVRILRGKASPPPEESIDIEDPRP